MDNFYNLINVSIGLCFFSWIILFIVDEQFSKKLKKLRLFKQNENKSINKHINELRFKFEYWRKIIFWIGIISFFLFLIFFGDRINDLPDIGNQWE